MIRYKFKFNFGLQSSLVTLNGFHKFFHSSIVLNADNNNNININEIDNQNLNDQVVINENIVNTAASVEPISQDLVNSVADFDIMYQGILRDIRDEEFKTAMEGMTSFGEAFPNFGGNKSKFGDLQDMMLLSQELPGPFKDSAVFNELKQNFIKDGLSFRESNSVNEVKFSFMKDVLKFTMEHGGDFNQINNLNDLEPNVEDRPKLVEFKGDSMIVNYKRVLELSPYIINFLKEHKEEIFFNGAGSVLSILFYYRTVVKLHAKVTELKAEELKLISASERVNFLIMRQKQLTFVSLVGGVLSALSLFGISHYILKPLANKKARDSMALVPFLTNNFNKFVKFDWRKFLVVCVCLIIVGMLYYLGIKSIRDLFNIYKLGLIFNLIFGFFIAYNSITMLLIINSPQHFDKSKIFKYLPKIFKIYYLNYYNITNQVLIKIYLRLFTLSIIISIVTLIFFNMLLLFIWL